MLALCSLALLLAACPALARPQAHQRAASPNSPCPPPGFSSITSFSLSRYISAPWYIVQQSPNSYQPLENLYCVSAEYRNLDFDSGKLQVHNQARIGSVSGEPEGLNISSLLSAIVVDGGRGQLAVGPPFVPAFAYGPYWVIAAGYVSDPDVYDWAIVSGGPPTVESNGKCKNTDQVDPDGNGEGLWLFFRTPTPDPALLLKTNELVDRLGFDASVLVNVEHRGCKYLPWPAA